MPAGPERLERLEEPAEDLGAKLTRGPVDAAAIVLRRLVAQVRRQLLDLHRMPRHDAERLDVHDEPVGRALGPALDHLLDRQPVVGRVDLDRVEVLRVVAEPLAGRHALRVPVLRERLVGPRAGADPDRSGHAARIRERGPFRGPAPTYSTSAYVLAVTMLNAKKEIVAVLQPCGTPGNAGAGHGSARSASSRTCTPKRVFFLIFLRNV